MDSLICQVDERVVAIPTVGLEQIVEMPTTPPPPDSMPWISGIGIFQGAAVAIVLLGRPTARVGRRHARGPLFGGAGVPRWMVEVTRVLSVADVRPIAHSTHPVDWETACLNEWFLDGVTSDRQVMALLDVGQVAAALSLSARLGL